MRYDVDPELAVLRTWRDSQPPATSVDDTTAGFLWALSLVTGTPADRLRDRLDGGPLVSPTPAVESSLPAAPQWRGLGIPRIDGRQREVVDGEPVAAPRAWTTGPDGRPIPAEGSYAERAARVPLVDTEGTETATGV